MERRKALAEADVWLERLDLEHVLAE